MESADSSTDKLEALRDAGLIYIPWFDMMYWVLANKFGCLLKLRSPPSSEVSLAALEEFTVERHLPCNIVQYTTFTIALHEVCQEAKWIYETAQKS